MSSFVCLELQFSSRPLLYSAHGPQDGQFLPWRGLAPCYKRGTFLWPPDSTCKVCSGCASHRRTAAGGGSTTSALLDIAKSLSRVATPIYTPTCGAWARPTLVLRGCCLASMINTKWCHLSCVSLITGDSDHLFRWLVTGGNFFPVNCLSVLLANFSPVSSALSHCLVQET
jgi:hypothetical protein